MHYGTSVVNMVSTRVPIQSLRASGGMQDFMAIVPKNMADTIPAGHTRILTDDGVKLYYSDPIPMPESIDSDPETSFSDKARVISKHSDDKQYFWEPWFLHYGRRQNRSMAGSSATPIRRWIYSAL